MVSDELNGLFLVLTGQQMPDADPKLMRLQLVAPQRELEAQLTEVQELVVRLAQSVAGESDGRFSEAYYEAMLTLAQPEGRAVLTGLRDAARQLGDAMEESAYQVEYLNLMIAFQLGMFLVEFAATFVMALFNPTQALMRQAFLRNHYGRLLASLKFRVLAAIVEQQVLQVGLAVAMDRLAQWRLARQGKHTRHGKSYLTQAAGSGAVAGFVAVPVQFAASWLAQNLLKGTARGAGDGLFDELDTALAGRPGGPPVKDAADPPERGAVPKPVPRPRPGQDADGFTGNTDTVFARAFADQVSGVVGRLSRAGDPVTVGRSFVDGMGEVFARRFGDGMGGDGPARRLGRDWADAFLGNLDRDGLGDALRSVLLDGRLPVSGLGDDVVRVMSQRVGHWFGPRGWGGKLLEFSVHGLGDGVTGVGSEVVYNVITQQKVSISGGAFLTAISSERFADAFTMGADWLAAKFKLPDLNLSLKNAVLNVGGPGPLSTTSTDNGTTDHGTTGGASAPTRAVTGDIDTGPPATGIGGGTRFEGVGPVSGPLSGVGAFDVPGMPGFGPTPVVSTTAHGSLSDASPESAGGLGEPLNGGPRLDSPTPTPDRPGEVPVPERVAETVPERVAETGAGNGREQPSAPQQRQGPALPPLPPLVGPGTTPGEPLGAVRNSADVPRTGDTRSADPRTPEPRPAEPRPTVGQPLSDRPTTASTHTRGDLFTALTSVPDTRADETDVSDLDSDNVSVVSRDSDDSALTVSTDFTDFTDVTELTDIDPDPQPTPPPPTFGVHSEQRLRTAVDAAITAVRAESDAADGTNRTDRTNHTGATNRTNATDRTDDHAHGPDTTRSTPPPPNRLDCFLLLEHLVSRLYPAASDTPFPRAVRAAASVDDSVIRTRDAEERLAPGPGWGPVTSWQDLTEGLAHLGPGSTALILTQHRSGAGHAYALYQSDEGVRWVEPQAERSDKRVRDALPAHWPFRTRAVLIASDGRITDPAQPLVGAEGKAAAHPLRTDPAEAMATVRRTATVDALVDPPGSNEFHGLGFEVELLYPLELPPGVQPPLEEKDVLARHVSGAELVVDKRTFFIAADGTVHAYARAAGPGARAEWRFIPELASAPSAVLAGEDWSPAAEAFAVHRDLRLALERTDTTGSTLNLATLLDTVPGWTVEPRMTEVWVTPSPAGPGHAAYSQLTVGVPTSGFTAMLDLARARLEQEWLTPLVDAARDYADRLTALYAEELLGRRPEPSEYPFLSRLPGLAELHGYAWVGFNHVAAYPFHRFERPDTLPKNLLPGALRTPFHQVREALAPGVVGFLDRRTDDATRLFLERMTALYREVEPEVDGDQLTDLLSETYTDEAEGESHTLGDRLSTVLSGTSSLGAPLTQWQMTGMQDYDGLDDNEGGTDPPLVLMELRRYTPRPELRQGPRRTSMTPDALEASFDEVRAVAARSHHEARTLAPADTTGLGDLLNRRLADPLVRQVGQVFGALEDTVETDDKGARWRALTVPGSAALAEAVLDHAERGNREEEVTALLSKLHQTLGQRLYGTRTAGGVPYPALRDRYQRAQEDIQVALRGLAGQGWDADQRPGTAGPARTRHTRQRSLHQPYVLNADLNAVMDAGLDRMMADLRADARARLAQVLARGVPLNPPSRPVGTAATRSLPAPGTGRVAHPPHESGRTGGEARPGDDASAGRMPPDPVTGSGHGSPRPPGRPADGDDASADRVPPDPVTDPGRGSPRPTGRPADGDDASADRVPPDPVTDPGRGSPRPSGRPAVRTVAALRTVVDTAVDTARRSGRLPGDDLHSWGACVILLESLTAVLHPPRPLDARRVPAAAHSDVRSPTTVDDSVLDTGTGTGSAGPRPVHGAGRATEQRLARGPGWATVFSWQALEQALALVGPGATALILTRRPHDDGHAYAAHQTDEGIRWIEMQAEPGARITEDRPVTAPHTVGRRITEALAVTSPGTTGPGIGPGRGDTPALHTRAVIIAPDGTVTDPTRPVRRDGTEADHPLGPAPRHRVPDADALTDAPTSSVFHRIGYEVELLFPLSWDGKQLQAGMVLARHLIAGRPSGAQLVVDAHQFFQSGTTLHGWRSQAGPGAQPRGLFIPELVGAPLRALREDRGAGRDVGFALHRSVRAMLGRSTGPRPRTLVDLLSEDPSWEVAPGMESVRVHPSTAGPDHPAYTQFTVGVPVAGLTPLLDLARGRLRVNQLIPLVDTARSFADTVTERYAGESLGQQEQGAQWTLEARHRPFLAYLPALTELHGYLQMGYLHAAALAYQTHVQPERIVRNMIPVASRVAFPDLHRALSTPARHFLLRNRDHITQLFGTSLTELLRATAPNVTNRVLARIMDTRPDVFESPRRSLDTVLMGPATPGGPVHLTSMTTMAEMGMDTSLGANRPLALFELRQYSPRPDLRQGTGTMSRFMTADALEASFDEIARTAQHAYDQSARFAAYRASRLPAVWRQYLQHSLVERIGALLASVEGLTEAGPDGRPGPVLPGDIAAELAAAAVQHASGLSLPDNTAWQLGVVHRKLRDLHTMTGPDSGAPEAIRARHSAALAAADSAVVAVEAAGHAQRQATEAGPSRETRSGKKYAPYPSPHTITRMVNTDDAMDRGLRAVFGQQGDGAFTGPDGAPSPLPPLRQLQGLHGGVSHGEFTAITGAEAGLLSGAVLRAVLHGLAGSLAVSALLSGIGPTPRNVWKEGTGPGRTHPVVNRSAPPPRRPEPDGLGGDRPGPARLAPTDGTPARTDAQGAPGTTPGSLSSAQRVFDILSGTPDDPDRTVAPADTADTADTAEGTGLPGTSYGPGPTAAGKRPADGLSPAVDADDPASATAFEEALADHGLSDIPPSWVRRAMLIHPAPIDLGPATTTTTNPQEHRQTYWRQIQRIAEALQDTFPTADPADSLPGTPDPSDRHATETRIVSDITGVPPRPAPGVRGGAPNKRNEKGGKEEKESERSSPYPPAKSRQGNLSGAKLAELIRRYYEQNPKKVGVMPKKAEVFEGHNIGGHFERLKIGRSDDPTLRDALTEAGFHFTTENKKIKLLDRRGTNWAAILRKYASTYPQRRGVVPDKNATFDGHNIGSFLNGIKSTARKDDPDLRAALLESGFELADLHNFILLKSENQKPNSEWAEITRRFYAENPEMRGFTPAESTVFEGENFGTFLRNLKATGRLSDPVLRRAFEDVGLAFSESRGRIWLHSESRHAAAVRSGGLRRRAAEQGLRVEDIVRDGDCFMHVLARVIPQQDGNGVPWQAQQFRTSLSFGLFDDLTRPPGQRRYWSGALDFTARTMWAEDAALRSGRSRDDPGFMDAVNEAQQWFGDDQRLQIAHDIGNAGQYNNVTGDVAPHAAARIFGRRLRVWNWNGVQLTPYTVVGPHDGEPPVPGAPAEPAYETVDVVREIGGPDGSEHWQPAFPLPQTAAPPRRIPVYDVQHLDQSWAVHTMAPEDADAPMDEDEELRITSYVEYRLHPDPDMDNAFPWRDPADPLHRVRPEFADENGRPHPNVTATEADFAREGKKRLLARLGQNPFRMNLSPQQWDQVWSAVLEDVLREVQRLIRHEQAPPRAVVRTVQARHTRPHESMLIGQYGLFLADPARPSGPVDDSTPADLTHVPREQLPLLSNGRILGLYVAASMRPREVDAYRQTHQTVFPGYALELEMGTQTLTMSAEGAANAMPFANTAVLPGEGALRYDHSVINTAFVELKIRMTQRNGTVRWWPIAALVAFDNAVSPANPEGMIVLDYRDNYLGHLKAEITTIKPEPEEPALDRDRTAP
ncbi:hypothetical protein ABZX40_36035 [Streptomyces sp. NPDC004610]|uniref:hypothetical protein n=1 Tax=unclassified Streptomyces TaxID=2593676 RepID=UPI0033AE2866